MDNNYYTGATLMRGSHNNNSHHHSYPHHHHHSNHGHGHFPLSPPAGGGAGGPNVSSPTSLAGPPLVMQPRSNKNRLFSGVPLIRNGPQSMGNCGAVIPVTPTVPNPPSQPPSEVICCFQPVYYVPMQPNPAPHSFSQFSLLPPPLPTPIKKPQPHATSQSGTPKRRNYKSLQISTKPTQNLYHNTTAPVTTTNISKGSGYQSPPAVEPTHASSPLMACDFMPMLPQMEENNSPPIEKIYCSGEGQDDNELNFQNAVESTRLVISNEEKQRSDKLLNFYFYDEHWRPRETVGSTSSQTSNSDSEFSNNNRFGQAAFTDQPFSTITSSSTPSTDTPWTNKLNGFNPHSSTSGDQNHHNLYSYGSTSSEQQTNNINATASIAVNEAKWRSKGLADNDSPSTLGTNTMVIKKKDLEVEAQIVTLANGHRDLEIRLCYVTS